MLLFTDPSPAEFGDEKGFKTFKGKIDTALKDAMSVNTFQTFFVELNDEATKLQRTLSNGMVGYGAQLEHKIFSIMKSGLDIGITMQDVTDYATELGDTLGRVPAIQEEVVAGMKSFSMMTGISMKELGKGIGEFDKIGMGQQQAQDKLTKIFFTAKAYGVNAKQLTAEVTKNLEKANGYQFKNGVDGLIKMAARAKQLGIDFEKIMNIGDKALDPDKAIEMASGMQMLGGNVGALGDPFKLLYMAQNDLGALQDEFIKVTAASAEYNKETGEFKIGTQQMYRLRQMAEELGLNYEDLAKSAIKARKEQEIMPKITQNMPEEDKQLIASMAEMKDGTWKVQLPGTDKWEDVQNLSKEQLDQIEAMQTEMNKSDGERLAALNDTAKSQLSKQEEQVLELRKLTTMNIFGAAGDAEMVDRGKDRLTAEDFGKVMNAYESMTIVIEEFKKTSKPFSDDLYNKFIDGLKKGTDAMEQYATAVMGLRKFINDTMNNLSVITPNENPNPTEPDINQDVFIPSNFKGKTLVKGDFGQFTTTPKDDFLAAPNIGEFIDDAQGAFSILNNMDLIVKNKINDFINTPIQSFGENVVNKNPISNQESFLPNSETTIDLSSILNSIETKTQTNLGTLQDLLTKNMDLENLSSVVNVNNKTTNEVTGNVGVNGDVKIKVEGLQGSLSQILDADPNFQRMFKENVMNIVNERLSKSYGEKLGNLS